MVTKLCLRSYTIPFTIFFSPIRFPLKLHSLHKSTTSSLLSTTTTNQHLSYGPSLLKGHPLSLINLQTPITHSQGTQQQAQETETETETEGEDDNILDEDQFTRIFNIAALRVPSKDCFDLESRLRGHLLNWPRIRNIARVPGDEVEDDIANLLNLKSEDVESIDSLNRRIHGKAEGDGDELSPVLYREKLAKTFNSRGYVRFRHLAKISRPQRKKGGRAGEVEVEVEERKGRGRNDVAVVEVVEEDGRDEMKGLLGEGFKGRSKWRGSTRLLLLDEKYADTGMEELPEAIKVVYKEDSAECASSNIELVRCRLTLFYDYWQMNEILESLLPESMIVPSAFEMVGHIAHLNLRDEHLPYKKLIAKVVLDKNPRKIQTVVNKMNSIQNDYRTMQLEVLAGNHSLVTTVVENGHRFHLDLATVYWNSRLGTERQRLLSAFNRYDVVCDVFSGVGPIAISAAKVVKRVYANDLNPYAIKYLESNSVLNRLEKKIEVFNMDGRRFINAMFTSDKAKSITHVVMNLPNDAAEYLDAFRGVYNDKPNDEELSFPMIHVYGFSKARDPEFEFHERIRIALLEVGVDVDMRRVRLVAPGKWMLCASFILPRSVALAKRTLDF